jgi:hypothetical protein
VCEAATWVEPPFGGGESFKAIRRFCRSCARLWHLTPWEADQPRAEVSRAKMRPSGGGRKAAHPGIRPSALAKLTVGH